MLYYNQTTRQRKSDSSLRTQLFEVKYSKRRCVISYAALEKQIESLPEEYLEEVSRYIQLLQYKIAALEQQKKEKQSNGIIFGLGKGKFKVPDDINAYDDVVTEEFENYL